MGVGGDGVSWGRRVWLAEGLSALGGMLSWAWAWAEEGDGVSWGRRKWLAVGVLAVGGLHSWGWM